MCESYRISCSDAGISIVKGKRYDNFHPRKNEFKARLNVVDTPDVLGESPVQRHIREIGGTELSTEYRQISVFDSTLRDGEQAPGNAMSPQHKLDIALALESIGVNTIETGFPNSSQADFAATRLISQVLSRAKFATLNRATRQDIQAAADAGGTHNHQLQILAAGSDIHLEHKRGITRAEGVREIVDSVRFARSLGFTDITLGMEDATRGSAEVLRPLIEAALVEGCGTVVVADTTGCMLPGEFGDLVHRVCRWTDGKATVSVHCHDDFGLSLPNALAAIDAGAQEVQATVAGIGERAGNTALEELAAVLAYRGTDLGVTTDVRTEGLYHTYELLRAAIGPVATRSKAIYGENAFATQAGIHQAGMLRNPVTYEFVEPSRFGRERTILVGRHSGRNVVRHLFTELGRPVTDRDPLLEEIYQHHVARRASGDCIEVNELRAIVSERLAQDASVPMGALS